jgi:hypothetical protein
VPRFLARFEDTYGRLGKTERILSVAAAHHRLLWIHPFLDGNSRVAAPKSGGGGGDFDGKINEIAAMGGILRRSASAPSERPFHGCL